MTPSLAEPMSAPIDHESGSFPDFRTLYRRYYSLVWWVVRGSGVPEGWVEDVVHDAFLIIHRRRGELDGDAKVRPWVIGIARNAAFSHRRGAARRKARLSAVPEPEGPSAVDSVVAYRQAWDQVRGFLSELDDEQREAFVLCELQGVAPAEVAQSLRVSRNTVYSRLRLARSKLVDHFSERPAGKLPGLVRAARQQGEPTRVEKRRTWAALVVQLPLDGGVAGVAGSSLGTWAMTVKAALVSVGLAAVVVTGIGLVGRAGARGEASETVAVEIEDGRGDGPSDRGSSPSNDAVPIGVASVDAVPQVVPSDGATTTSVANTVGHGGPAKSPPATTTPPADDDVMLLQQAAQQLERGDAANALATLTRHAERHPDSALRQERLGLRVRALCATDATAKAEAIAARYVAEHPGTRLAAVLAEPCAD